MTDPIQTLGRYTIQAELGRGGFATVYRAVDTSLNREVALKILHPQLLTDRSFVDRFRKEARTLANLRHPHIITLYEVSEVENRLFIAMELARGSSLAQAITQRQRLPWSETLALLKPVSEALDYAHGQGVIHRDLKPANILLDDERGLLLTDFGFARLMSDNSVSMSLSGGILGTPAYIAPEVWELDQATGAVDIYALGCIAYEMITGETLFTGKTPMQTMRAHDRGPQFAVNWPPDAPAGLDRALQVALARQPEARYPSASALWHALNDLEANAQAEREKAERQAVAAQWQAEAEEALAEHEWSAAKMAVGRWLAITPDDAAALAFRDNIARQVEQEAQEAREAGKKQAAEATVAAIAIEAARKAQEAQDAEAARKAKEEAEAKARREAEEQERQRQAAIAAQEKTKREAELAAIAAAEAKAKQEAEEQDRQRQAAIAAQEKTKREAELAAIAAAEAKAKQEAVEQERQRQAAIVAEEKAKREAEEKAKRDAEAAAVAAQIRREAEEKQRREAEEKAKHEAAAVATVTASAVTQPKESVPTSMTVPTPPPAKSKAWVYAVGAIVVVVALVIVLALSGGGQATPASAPAADVATLVPTAMVAPTLAAPILISPADGIVFDHFPRTTTLQWKSVPGAAAYMVEIAAQDPSDGSWLGLGIHQVDSTTYTFDFVGMQPGRWRVWAVDANGHEGQKSNWWGFVYNR